MTSSTVAADYPLPRPTVIWRGWSWFWFTPADPTLLGLIRILCGLFTFYVYLAYTVDLQEFFGPEAWVDAAQVEEFRHNQPILRPVATWSSDEAAAHGTAASLDSPEAAEFFQKYRFPMSQLHARGTWLWSVWFHVTDPTWIAVIHGFILFFIFLFAIGFCTPVTSVLTWIGVVSYIQRSPVTLFGMDTMMNLVLLYLIVGQSGAALSVDRLVARYRASRRLLAEHGTVLGEALKPRPRVSANLGLRLIQVNLCIIYLTSGLTKLQGPAWWNGNAVWNTVSNPEFSPLYFAPFYAMLQFLCHHRLLWELAITSGSVFTLIMEIGFPFLVWVRQLRWVMLTMAVMMHTGIALFMGLNTFSLMMICMLLAFVPGEVIHRAIANLGRRAAHFRLLLRSDAQAPMRGAALVKAVDVWDQADVQAQLPARRSRTPAEPAPLVPMGDRPALEAVRANGTCITDQALFEYLVRTLVLLRPVFWLRWVPGIKPVGMSLLAVTSTVTADAIPETSTSKRSTRAEKVAP
jgi:hypothetical protein